MRPVQIAPRSSGSNRGESLRRAINLIGMLVLLCEVPAAVFAQHAAARDTESSVIYEIPTRASARPVLRAVEAHLDERSRMTIVVVAHGGGVEAMLKGAIDAKGVRYATAVEQLSRRGVDFAVCGATLKSRGIGHDRVIAEGRIVPRGSGEIARLIGLGYQPLN